MKDLENERKEKKGEVGDRKRSFYLFLERTKRKGRSKYLPGLGFKMMMSRGRSF